MNPTALLLIAALGASPQPPVELSEEERKARRQAEADRKADFERSAAEHKAAMEKRAAEWEAGRAAREAEESRAQFETHLFDLRAIARQEEEQARREAEAYLRSQQRRARRGEGL